LVRSGVARVEEIHVEIRVWRRRRGAARNIIEQGRHITALVPGNPLPVKAFIKQRMRVRRIVIRRG